MADDNKCSIKTIIKRRLQYYPSVFVVFFIAIGLEDFLGLIDINLSCEFLKPIILSTGITFCTNKLLKEISKKEAHDELETLFQKSLYFASDSVRKKISGNITASKTLLDQSLKDGKRTVLQFKDDQSTLFKNIKRIESGWNSLERLLKGEKNEK